MKLALRYLVFVAALAAAPLVFGYVPFFTMATAVQIGIMAIGAVGLILVSGYARQVSIGQAAFFAIGAYAAAVLTTGPAVPPALAAVAGMALSGATAVVVGLFVFRVRGHYLALATLAFGLVVYYLVQQLGFTGGPTGIPDIRSWRSAAWSSAATGRTTGLSRESCWPRSRSPTRWCDPRSAGRCGRSATARSRRPRAASMCDGTR